VPSCTLMRGTSLGIGAFRTISTILALGLPCMITELLSMVSHSRAVLVAFVAFVLE
jgi:hypothetical protein